MKIERIVSGRVMGVPKIYQNGKFKCHPKGQNMEHHWCSTLEEVADYLRKNPGSGVRMTPKGSKVIENIFIDGKSR